VVSGPSVNRVKFAGSADIVHTSGAIAAVVSTSNGSVLV